MTQRVSCIIPTLNRPAYLFVTLSSLLSQTFKAWDLIIVDDSKEDLRRYYLAKGLFRLLEFEGHDLIILKGNRRGMDDALNKGVSASQNELCLRMDDDSWLCPNYIELLYNFIQRDERIAGVGGSTPNVFHDKDTLTKIDEELEKYAGHLVFKDGRHIPYERQSKLPREGDIPYEVVCLRGHFLFRKRALDDVGGFPTDYSQFARREEVDTCLRLRLGGYRLWVVPQAICWHIFSPQGGTRELGEDWQSSTKAKTYIEHDLQLFEKKLSEWLKQDKAMALNIIRGDNDV